MNMKMNEDDEYEYTKEEDGSEYDSSYEDDEEDPKADLEHANNL
jgi:hypothetical protein